MVLARAQVLSALVNRAVAESPDSYEGLDAQQGMEWMRDCLAGDASQRALTRRERELTARPLGGLSDEEVMSCRFAYDALGMLAWALGRAELPQVTEDFALEDEAAVPKEFTEQPLPSRLRSLRQIEKVRYGLELWNWRVFYRVAEDDGRRMNPWYAAAARLHIAEEAHRVGVAGPPVAGDLNAWDRAFSALDDDLAEQLGWRIYHRLGAAIWLAGHVDGDGDGDDYRNTLFQLPLPLPVDDEGPGSRTDEGVEHP